jgi:integrase
MSLPKYLTKRKQGFYAVLEIPKALRPSFDNKPRFLQSLETRELRTAERRLPVVIAGWKALLDKAKGMDNPHTGFMWELMQWRETAKGIGVQGSDPELVGRWLAEDFLEKIEREKGNDAAQEAAGIIFGNNEPLKSHLEPWLATVTHLSSKTQSLQKLAVSEFIGYFKTTDKLTKQGIKEYLAHLRGEKGLSDKTISMRVSYIRSFAKYLDDHIGSEFLPMVTTKALPRLSTAKTIKQRAWVPFDADDVSKLYQAALDKKIRGKKVGDRELADLIAVGAYSGCRIEELAQLRIEDFSSGSFKVRDAKTAAGIREVPIHPALLPTINRLKGDRKEGYLLAGSDKGSHGKRGDALGKRFGRLKTELGYGELSVFHSVRKAVVSLLEQAGVGENVTADIVGHDKPRITYGLYSSGTSLEQKAEALAKVKYRGALATPQ